MSLVPISAVRSVPHPSREAYSVKGTFTPIPKSLLESISAESLPFLRPPLPPKIEAIFDKKIVHFRDDSFLDSSFMKALTRFATSCISQNRVIRGEGMEALLRLTPDDERNLKEIEALLNGLDLALSETVNDLSQFLLNEVRLRACDYFGIPILSLAFKKAESEGQVGTIVEVYKKIKEQESALGFSVETLIEDKDLIFAFVTANGNVQIQEDFLGLFSERLLAVPFETLKANLLNPQINFDLGRIAPEDVLNASLEVLEIFELMIKLYGSQEIDLLSEIPEEDISSLFYHCASDIHLLTLFITHFGPLGCNRLDVIDSESLSQALQKAATSDFESLKILLDIFGPVHIDLVKELTTEDISHILSRAAESHPEALRYLINYMGPDGLDKLSDLEAEEVLNIFISASDLEESLHIVLEAFRTHEEGIDEIKDYMDQAFTEELNQETDVINLILGFEAIHPDFSAENISREHIFNIFNEATENPLALALAFLIFGPSGVNRLNELTAEQFRSLFVDTLCDPASLSIFLTRIDVEGFPYNPTADDLTDVLLEIDEENSVSLADLIAYFGVEGKDLLKDITFENKLRILKNLVSLPNEFKSIVNAFMQDPSPDFRQALKNHLVEVLPSSIGDLNLDRMLVDALDPELEFILPIFNTIDEGRALVAVAEDPIALKLFFLVFAPAGSDPLHELEDETIRRAFVRSASNFSSLDLFTEFFTSADACYLNSILDEKTLEEALMNSISNVSAFATLILILQGSEAEPLFNQISKEVLFEVRAKVASFPKQHVVLFKRTFEGHPNWAVAHANGRKRKGRGSSGKSAQKK